MIVSIPDGGTRVAAGAVEARWRCLVRRGMLHSECEAVEHWELPAGATLEITPGHGVEEVLILLDGGLLVETSADTARMRAGQTALMPHGVRGLVRADVGSARLVTVRALAGEVADRLPPRVPELVPPRGGEGG